MIKSLENIKFLSYLIFLLPVSLVSGNLILNINLFLITISFFFLILFKNDFRKYLKTDWIIVCVFFYFFQIFISIYNDFSTTSLIRSLGFIKFFILGICLKIVFLDNKKNFRHFSVILFLVFLFILFDSLIQHFFGQNIFGTVKSDSRLSSIFSGEYIVGSFLSKISFIITPVIFLFYKQEKYKFFLVFIWLCFLCFAILLTGERMASLHFIMGVSLYFIYSSIKNLKNIIYIGIFFIVTFTLIIMNDSTSRRFKEITHEKYGIGKEFKIKDSIWGAHFLTAYEIFKNYPLTGVGSKNFRVEACKSKYETIDSTRVSQRCTTHPHNIVLEILSEHGIIGFIFLIIIFYLVLRKYKIAHENNIFFLISFIIYIWPIGTSGSIFTSWNGTFLWINIGIISYLSNISNKESFKKN